MSRRTVRHGSLVGLGVGLAACQTILGFEDFEPLAPGGSGSGASAGSEAGAGPSGNGSGASAGGEAGAGLGGRGSGGSTARKAGAGPGGNGSGASAGSEAGAGLGGNGSSGRAGSEAAGGGGGRAGAGGSGSGGASGRGGGRGGSSMGDAGAAGQRGTIGVACDADADCAGELTCLYGYCRTQCSDDTVCPPQSVCLFRSATGGGCRLDSETCEDAKCENADLVCGIDSTCRIGCSKDNSCDAPTQRCIAGSCVSTVGAGADDWDCGSVADGEVTCDGRRLAVCNVLEPGLGTIEACPSDALCQASLPDPPTFDAASPPECVPGCQATKPYCEGVTLLECNDEGSGPVDAGVSCATAELCEASVDADRSICLAPACDGTDVRCTGAQTELVVQVCNADRTGFSNRADCAAKDQQCNPAATACFDLDIDATEVTMAEYADWLATGPDTVDQPPGCAWNDGFDLDSGCLASSAVACTGSDCHNPVVCLDWCDALAYCTAHGQRLCGRIGGGMNPFDRADDPGSSEWMNACSAGGQYDFGGGASPIAGADQCWYQGNSNGKTYAVGTHAKCQSPSPGYSFVKDLSGNAAEWEDSCEVIVTSGQAGPDDACRTRGGSISSTTKEQLRCDAVPASALTRSSVSATVGFRCCG